MPARYHGISHVCFEVDDIHVLDDRLRTEDIRFHSACIRIPSSFR